MRRRRFIQLAPALPVVLARAVPGCGGSSALDRIGLSTVLLRRRFVQTRPEGETATPQLTLLETPAYLRDRFGIRHVEFWSRHFESLEPAYLNRLRSRIEASGATLINIQCDEGYQIGAPDPSKRRKSLDLVLSWVEAAARLGARAIRVNPGKGRLPLVMEAYRTILAAARDRGLHLLIENHFGLATDPSVHLRMVRRLGSGAVGTLPDYGNYPDDTRYADLERVMPLAYQVSAKAMDFDAAGKHTSYDFDRCMEIAEASGFAGIYSVEQWSRQPTTLSDEWIADWLIERVRNHLS